MNGFPCNYVVMSTPALQKRLMLLEYNLAAKGYQGEQDN